MTTRLRACFAAAAAVACVTLAAQQADQAPTDTAAALARRASERLASLHDEADRLAAEERTVLGDLRRLEVEREIKSEEARQAEEDVRRVASELTALDADVAAIEQQERDAEPELRDRLVSLYKLGSGSYTRLLLSTTDIRQLGRASRMVAALAERDRQRVAEHQDRLAELASRRRTLEERQTQLAALRADALEAQEAATAAVAARNTLIRTIDARRDLNAQLAGELVAAQEKLQAIVAGMAANPSAVAAALPIAPFRGDLDWPLTGRVRQGFGGGSNSRGTANGIDIAAAEGTEVRAVHDGTVVYGSAFTGFGRLVIVDHGAQTFTLYGNLKDIDVAQGVRVERGTRVGSAGVAPSGAEGLYFELRVDGRPVDPLQWLKKR